MGSACSFSIWGAQYYSRLVKAVLDNNFSEKKYLLPKSVSVENAMQKIAAACAFVTLQEVEEVRKAFMKRFQLYIEVKDLERLLQLRLQRKIS